MTHLAVLRRSSETGTLGSMDEPEGIYRGEVLAIMGVLADVYADTTRILELLEGNGDDDESEEADA